MVPQTSPRAERDKKIPKIVAGAVAPLIKVSGTSQRWNPGHRLADARRALLAHPYGGDWRAPPATLRRVREPDREQGTST